jgi:riboflavin biosynthesis pyrimidine reductase/pyrimidine deaminase RibD-like protein
MTTRPFVLLSAAMSIDGYLDDATDQRLVLSNDADWDRVDEVRAGCDAILVGAGTVRRDNPRLVIRSPARRARRVAEGLPADPVKVVLSRSGDLDPEAAFFTVGDGEKLVYADIDTMLADLAARGVRRLMVEGGTGTHTSFLTRGLADELHLVVAPFFVGDHAAPRLVHDGRFPWHRDRRATLAEVRRIGNVVLHRYLLSEREVDRYWLEQAVELARRCPPSDTAFAVGAIVVDAHGEEIARGYSRETDDRVHAEEAALARLDPADPRLANATIYSSLEPCSRRRSRPRTCTRLILDAGIPRVVFALREPPTFVDGEGAELLAAAGRVVLERPDLAGGVREVNRSLLPA